MKLVHYRLPRPNFGDELNPWMWPQLAPGFFDEDERVRFIGVGSIISGEFDGGGLKVVCGAGFAPDYAPAPDLTGGDWRFEWVRGPRTAAALGLDPALGLGDSAILLRALIPPDGSAGEAVSFMPHWESLNWGHWAEACDLAGITLIDPRQPVPAVLSAIRASRLILCEAMHGAIVADALRIPWIALTPIAPRHRDKWRDWADSLGLDLRPRRLLSSSPVEVLAGYTRRWNALARARAVFRAAPMTPVRTIAIRLAAARLRQIAADPGRLSDESRLKRATAAMLEALERLKADRRAGRL